MDKDEFARILAEKLVNEALFYVKITVWAIVACLIMTTFRAEIHTLCWFLAVRFGIVDDQRPKRRSEADV